MQKKIKHKGYRRIGIIGTKPDMVLKFYLMITSAEVFIPKDKLLDNVDKAYTEMVTLDRANKELKEIFEKVCNQFLIKDKVDSVMLEGTDLALIYRSHNVDFKLIDCAKKSRTIH